MVEWSGSASCRSSLNVRKASVPVKQSKSATSETTAPSKVGFVSLGCPKNLVDSEVMMGMLTQAGAQLTPDAEDADVIVVNTCSFIGSAQQESIDTILEMARHKTGGKRQAPGGYRLPGRAFSR